MAGQPSTSDATQFMDTGHVAHTIRQLGTRLNVAGAGDMGIGAGLHHGHAELGRSRPRARSRDRARAASQPPVRSNTVGPQETIDWLEALERVHDRLDTQDRFQRLHGQSISHL